MQKGVLDIKYVKDYPKEILKTFITLFSIILRFVIGYSISIIASNN